MMESGKWPKLRICIRAFKVGMNLYKNTELRVWNVMKYGILILMVVVCATLIIGCSEPFDSFESEFDARSGEFDEIEKVIGHVDDFDYVSIITDAGGVLKGKTHDVTSTITVRCHNEADYKKFREEKSVLKEEAERLFKKINYEELIEMESYRSIELQIKKKLVDELGIESRMLIVEVSDIEMTERE